MSYVVVMSCHVALEQLDLSQNYITGTLPASIGNLSRLELFNLGKNGFTDIGKCEDEPGDMYQ